jgi:hypothetical protein
MATSARSLIFIMPLLSLLDRRLDGGWIIPRGRHPAKRAARRCVDREAARGRRAELAPRDPIELAEFKCAILLRACSRHLHNRASRRIDPLIPRIESVVNFTKATTA